MAEKVKIYEEKKSSTSIWLWLLPLLLLAAILAYFLLHKRHDATAPINPSTTAATVAPAAFPDLGVVHFATDKADLTPAGMATLDRAADAMKSNPAAHLRLEGYTDSTGTPAVNAPLSDQRAYTVANYLKSKGIEGSRLTGGGFANANPVNTNATEAGKADNRRVELFSQQ